MTWVSTNWPRNSSASIANLRNISNVFKLPISAARCHAMIPNMYLSSNIFFNSFGFCCISSDQTPSFCNIYTWVHCAPLCKVVLPSLFWTGYNSCRYNSAPLSQLLNISNASKLPNCAARCHALYPWLFLASNNF
jgi:hypothetical protein